MHFRLDVATNGIVVPAAIAQHHSKLEPWEVCNRDLPHGAIVAYYRSPFPNVGAAAIAVNNLEVLRDRDPEAFDRRGVVYLSPWTAKQIAITDFDGDLAGSGATRFQLEEMFRDYGFNLELSQLKNTFTMISCVSYLPKRMSMDWEDSIASLKPLQTQDRQTRSNSSGFRRIAA